MIKKSSVIIVLLYAVFSFGTPVAGYANDQIPPNHIEAAEEGGGGGGAKGAAKGCASGAIAGTVVPGLGNLIGCAVGGIAGWFWW